MVSPCYLAGFEVLLGAFNPKILVRTHFFAALLTIGTAVSAFAGHEEIAGKKTVLPDEFPFTRGTVEVEIGAGAFGSIGTKGTPTRPDVGYALGQVRLGLMLSDVMGSGCFRGNVEGLLGAYGAGIFSGPGDDIFGAEFMLRWNFVQPNWKIVPFFQVGGGGAYSDMAEDDAVQHLIGSDLSFTFAGEVGFRYLVSRNFAITGGVEFRHISNADTSDRNRGLNSLGGTIGISLFY